MMAFWHYTLSTHIYIIIPSSFYSTYRIKETSDRESQKLCIVGKANRSTAHVSLAYITVDIPPRTDRHPSVAVECIKFKEGRRRGTTSFTFMVQGT